MALGAKLSDGSWFVMLIVRLTDFQPNDSVISLISMFKHCDVCLKSHEKVRPCVSL